MGSLEGRVCIVTGSSSGIGQAIALKLGSEGADLVLADVQEYPIEGGTSTLALLTEAGIEAEFVATDMGVVESVDHLVDHVVTTKGSLDVAVNNAAISVWKPLLDTEPADWDRVFAVNVRGVYALSRRAVAQMRLQPEREGVRGRIVNISSVHGMVSAPEDCAYGTSKSAVVYLTRQVAADYAREGIICNAVAPGKIFTGKGGREEDERWLDYWEHRIPTPLQTRRGKPEDIANAVAFLASDSASYINGANLMVDGAWSAY